MTEKLLKAVEKAANKLTAMLPEPVEGFFLHFELDETMNEEVIGEEIPDGVGSLFVGRGYVISNEKLTEIEDDEEAYEKMIASAMELEPITDGSGDVIAEPVKYVQLDHCGMLLSPTYTPGKTLLILQGGCVEDVGAGKPSIAKIRKFAEYFHLYEKALSVGIEEENKEYQKLLRRREAAKKAKAKRPDKELELIDHLESL